MDAGRNAGSSSSSDAESMLSSSDESDIEAELDSSSSGGAATRSRATKTESLTPFRNPAGSTVSQWTSREKQFEAFRAGLVTLPLPDGIKRIEKAKGYSLHIMSVLNWMLPEAILLPRTTSNQLLQQDGEGSSDEDDELILTLGAHVSMFHAPTKRFFGNTWVTPEVPIDPSQIKQCQQSKGAISYIVENAQLNFRAYFISDIADADCVGVVELVAYQKDPDSKATVEVTGCGWTIVPLFSRQGKGSAGAPPLAFSMDTSGQSINVFAGTPRMLWEVESTAWNSLDILENCKLFYQLVQYDPIFAIGMFLRRNELVGALETIPGLKNANLANIDVGRNPKLLLCEEQDTTYGEALATFAKLASLVPKTICVEETFELDVIATRVAVHLRQKVESDLLARLTISRKAIHDGASSIRGEISARVLKIALHNGRCFRTRQHTVPLKVDQAGDDVLRCVSNRTRLKGFVLHPFVAVVLMLQFTVHFRLEWPTKLKQQALDSKRPLPPEEDVVLVTIGSRAIIPSDGKKLYMYDKHHHATAYSARLFAMGVDEANESKELAKQPVLHVDLLSGSPCRPYSDNTLYTPASHTTQLLSTASYKDTSISFCDIKILPGEYKGMRKEETAPPQAQVDVSVPAEPPKSPNNQLSDTDDGVKQRDGRAAEKWAKKLLDKASNNSLLAQVLNTIADTESEQPQAQVTPLALPSPSKPPVDIKASPKKQEAPKPLSLLPANEHSSELSRASKTLLARYGYMDSVDSQEVLASSSDRTVAAKSEKTKKRVAMPVKSLEAEIKDIYKANEIRFHFAALRTFINTERFGGHPFTANRVYFTFQFYNFAPTRTEPLVLRDGFSTDTSGASKTMLLMREKPVDKPSLAIQFELDTSATLNPLETRQFAEYLLTKNLFVDIWDADSLFLLGTFKVPLHELLRQGAGIKKFQAEIDILEPIDGAVDSSDPGLADDDHHLAVSRVLDIGNDVECRGRAVVARIQILTSNYGLKGENRLDAMAAQTAHSSIIGEGRQMQESPPTVTAGSQSKTRRVRARTLVESNPELRRLLTQEGFYSRPKISDEGNRCRNQQRSRSGGDGLTLTSEEITILCDRFRKPTASGHSSTRIVCDLESKTGLGALLSLRPAEPTTVTPVSAPTPVADPVAHPVKENIPKAAHKSVDESAKKREAANADRLQRVLRLACKNKVGLEDAFQLFDLDGDGFLSHAEFVSALCSLGAVFAKFSEDDLIALADSMDANKDGKINYTEFSAFLTRNQTSQERADTWRERIKRIVTLATEKGVRVDHVFIQLDSSGDGKLSVEEFTAALKQLGIPIDRDPEGLKSLLLEFDSDRDGQISYQEFIQSLGIPFELNRAEVVKETSKDIVAQVREVMKRLEARGVNMGDAFVHFDKDKNGTLSIEEFMDALNRLLQSDVALEGMKKDESVLKSLEREAVVSVMNGVNANHDDKVDYYEFLTFCGISREAIQEKEKELHQAKLAKAEKKLIKLVVRACASGLQLSDIFKHFDANADGDISTFEFQKSFEQLIQGHHLDPEDTKQIAARFDTNCDGKISSREFHSFGEEIVRNHRSLESMLGPHTKTLAIIAKEVNGAVVTREKWSEFSRVQLKLKPKQMESIRKLLTYFDLADGNGGVNVVELIEMVQTVESPVAPSQPSTVVESPMERLKKLLLQAKQQGVDIKNSFGHFDADGSGEVTRDELRSGLLALGIFNDITSSELDNVLNELDSDSSGMISFREFTALIDDPQSSKADKNDNEEDSNNSTISKLQQLISAAISQGLSIESCFAHFDKNMDGKISTKEFKTAMIELGLATKGQQKLVHEIGCVLDRDNSGEVDLAEFKRHFASVAPATVPEKPSTPRNDETPMPITCVSAEATKTLRENDQPSTGTLDRLRALLLSAQENGIGVKASFGHFDTNGDGNITTDEFVTSLRQLPGFESIPEDEIRSSVVLALDTNSSGSISLHEFEDFLANGASNKKTEIKENSEIIAKTAQSELLKEDVETIVSGGNDESAAPTSEEVGLVSVKAEDPAQKSNPPTEEPATYQNDKLLGQDKSVGADKQNDVESRSAADTSSSTPPVKGKPSLSRAGSFSGSTRGKPRAGARPSLAATRRAKSDPDAMQAEQAVAAVTDAAEGEKGDAVQHKNDEAAGAERSVEATKTTRRPSFAAARAATSKIVKPAATDEGSCKDNNSTTATENGKQESEKSSSTDTAAVHPKPTRRPSFASTRAASAKGKNAVDASTTKDEGETTFSKSKPALSAPSTAATTGLESLRSLLNAAQKAGVDVQQSFNHFDKDQNGQLTHAEFSQGLRELGPEFSALSDEQVGEIIVALDRDQLGEIRVRDLVAFMSARDDAKTEISESMAKDTVGNYSANVAEQQSEPSKEMNSAPSETSATSRRRLSTSSGIGKPPTGIQRRMSAASTKSLPSKNIPTDDSPGTGVVDSSQTSSKANAPSTNPASTAESSSTTIPSTQNTEDCAYAFHSDPTVRAVELKLRRAAVDAYSRGVLPLRVLNKFLEGNYSGSQKAQDKRRQRSEILRVEFLQVLMELGFTLESDRQYEEGSMMHGRYSGCATRMNDHLYARQLERLSRYRSLTKSKDDERARKQLVRAATGSIKSRAVDNQGTASLQKFMEDKQQLLRVLSYYRDGQKKGLVYSLLREQVTTSLSLFPTFAELLFLELPFRNPYNHHERFRVELVLPTDAERAQLVDVDIVRSSPEWSFYRRYIPLAFPTGENFGDLDDDPVESEMIDNQNEFVMDSFDALHMPLRLRWLDASTSVASDRSRSRLIGNQLGEGEGSDRHAVPMSIMIKSCSHGHTVALFKLSLRPRPFVCNRVLRFSHPGGSIWRWKLRCPRGAFVVCMDPRVAVEVMGDPDGGVDVDGTEDSIVCFKCRVGEYPTLEQFYVVAYGDKYLARVLETWQVRIQSRLRVDAHATTGQRVSSELVIRTPDDESAGGRRLVQCFTRSKDCDHVQFRPSSIFQLAPRAFNRIEMAYCSVDGLNLQTSASSVPAMSTDIVLVNLVDVERRELVGAWSVRMALAPPRVTKTFVLRVPADQGAQKKIPYTNPWDVPQLIVLRSSARIRMVPRESELLVPPHGRVFLRLVFFPKEVAMPAAASTTAKRGEAEDAMYLFINDKPTDENEECLLFQVTYV